MRRGIQAPELNSGDSPLSAQALEGLSEEVSPTGVSPSRGNLVNRPLQLIRPVRLTSPRRLGFPRRAVQASEETSEDTHLPL
jgi:hypothetical protein